MQSLSVSTATTHPKREVYAPLTFYTKEGTFQASGKVDTGAMVSCMPVSMLPQLGLTEEDLTPSHATIRGISGADLVNCGTVAPKVSCNGMNADVEFYVTKNSSAFILGLEFCKKFKLVTIAPVCTHPVEAVHLTDESEVDYDELRDKWKAHLPLGKKTGDPLQDLKQIFPDAFDGQVGLFDGETSLKLSPEASPVQLAPRSVPQSIMPQLKKELDRMEQEGIIRACPETTDWVHNLVTVVKKDGTLRLCLDPRNLNKYLIRNVHYTASWEDALHSFRHGQYFSTLDAKSGYWTKKLDERSQLLTAFNTPFKKYCFVRLPFGLSVSSEIFCEHMDRALAGIPGTFPCADDVKIQGSTEERHDIHLLETVEKARKEGLKFHPDKCCIKKQEVEYFGRIVTPNGVGPCPKKVDAIASLAAPADKTELQSLLGSINFMAVFIPNLAKKTQLMRGLLKHNAHFIWTSDMQKELDLVKAAITNAVQLVHYDPQKPVVIETDASLKGLGAVLIQDSKPVRFLSKALTPAEGNYANIERELLAIVFACEKLHNYTFGRKVTVHTDHKPLTSIFQKPISLAPARLQRMLLRLSKYDIDIKYVGSKSVLLADTLSRLIDADGAEPVPGLDVNIAQVIKVEPTLLDSLREETKADPTLSDLKDRIMGGWPDSMQDLPDRLHPFWCFRDELTMLDGLVMKGNRIVIPAKLRPRTLERLHDAHQGLTSTLQRARRTVYWPKIQNDIEDTILRCDECQRHGSKKAKSSERQMSAVRPMEIIGMDIMQYKGAHSLVTVDYYSGAIFVDQLSSETADAVIKVLNINFRKFGLAETVVSDNGPCFRSERFQGFCQELGIRHVTSSPHYHQSNGRSERAIATVKQMLKKTGSDVEVTKALTAYLDTPVSDSLPSPAELFFNRRINTRLSIAVTPGTLDEEQKQQLSAKRSAHLERPKREIVYKTNQPIWFTEDGSPDWKPGHIDGEDSAPNSYWIISQDSNRRVRRNCHDLKPRYLKAATKSSNLQLPNNATAEARASTRKPKPLRDPNFVYT